MAVASNTARLKRMTTRAKAIRKANPRMSWRDAVKKAGAELRGKGKKAAPVKRATVVKKTNYAGGKTGLRKKSSETSVTIGSTGKFFVATNSGGFIVTALNRTEAATKGRAKIRDYNATFKARYGKAGGIKYKSVHPF